MILRGLGLLAVVALGVVSVPPSSDAQRPSKVPRVGYLAPGPQPAREESFHQELRRLGYPEGQNIVRAEQVIE